MKKIIAVVGLCLLLAAGVVMANVGEWTINADGVVSKLTPLEINGKLYFFIDDMAKALGMEMSTDKPTSTILLQKKVDAAQPRTAGSIAGDVEVKYKNALQPVATQDVFITKVNTDPDQVIEQQLKWHFYGGDRSYFIKHPYVGTAKLDNAGKFVIPSVTPGEYDLLFFTDLKGGGGTVRYVWRLRVWVDAGHETRVRLDDFNKYMRYGRMLQ